MMDATWGEVIKYAVLALCTWYLRRGTNQDVSRAANRVITSTAAQSTSEAILERLIAVETDLAIIKRATVKYATIDDRGPTPKHGGE